MQYQPPEIQWLQAEQGKYHGTRSLHFPLPFASLALIHTSLNGCCATTTLCIVTFLIIAPYKYSYLHTPLGQPDGVVLHYTTLVPFLGLRIGPACEACLSVGMGREGVPPCRRKKIKKEDRCKDVVIRCCTRSVRYGGCPVCNVLKVKVSISDCLPHLCVSQ